MSVMSVLYLALPLLQHCAYVSLLSVGPCCVSQTIGLQGVGTCMINTNKSTVQTLEKYAFVGKKSSSFTIRICTQHLSRRVNTSIQRVGVWGERSHGSGVTETNCSVAGGPRNDPVGGFISATRANNTLFDPYIRTLTLWIIIQSIHTAGCCRLGAFETQEHTLPHSRRGQMDDTFVKRIIFKKP